MLCFWVQQSNRDAYNAETHIVIWIFYILFNATFSFHLSAFSPIHIFIFFFLTTLFFRMLQRLSTIRIHIKNGLVASSDESFLCFWIPRFVGVFSFLKYSCEINFVVPVCSILPRPHCVAYRVAYLNFCNFSLAECFDEQSPSKFCSFEADVDIHLKRQTHWIFSFNS